MIIHQALVSGRHPSRLSNEISKDLVHKVRNLAMVAVLGLEAIAQQAPARARAKHELVENSILGMVDLVESALVAAKASLGPER